MAYCRCIYSALTSARLGLPVIFELHALPPRGGRIDRLRLPALLAHPNCVGLCAITNALKNDVIARYGVSPERVFVAPDGADEPRPGAPVVLPSQRLHVGYTGQLYPGKGMEVVLPLARACPWAEFHVIGGIEPYLSRWRDSARDLPNLTFCGHLPPAQVASWLAVLDVVLLPNQRSVESSGGDDIARWTSPLKLFEYMAAEKPILASDLPVLREVLRHGENALLCNPDKPQGWAEALLHLRDNCSLRAQLGTAARNDWARNYTWDARAQRVMAEVQERLGKAKARRGRAKST
jgi:glycosyltransferase involved in cell wall biosynthesis